MSVKKDLNNDDIFEMLGETEVTEEELEAAIKENDVKVKKLPKEYIDHVKNNFENRIGRVTGEKENTEATAKHIKDFTKEEIEKENSDILNETWELTKKGERAEVNIVFPTRFNIKISKPRQLDEKDNVDRATYIPPEIRMLQMMTAGESLKSSKFEQNKTGMNQEEIEKFEEARKLMYNKFEAQDLAKKAKRSIDEVKSRAQMLEEKYENYKKENEIIQQAYNIAKSNKTE